jgi:hypothetical protein
MLQFHLFKKISIPMLCAGCLCVGACIYAVVLLASASQSEQDKALRELETFDAPSRLNILRILDNAPIAARQFRVSSKIDTNYKINHIRPFYFSPSAKVLTALPEKYFVQSNVIDLTFQHTPNELEYLVLHITYGPAFVFERNSEALCMIRFEAGQIFDNIACNTITTAQFLVAHSMLDGAEPDPIHLDVLMHLVEVKKLPMIGSYQNYLGLLAILQGHLAESPQYTTASGKNMFLQTLIPFARQLRAEFLTKRRIDVERFEAILKSLDRSMISMAYRLYMSLDTLLERHSTGLPSLITRGNYLKDFLSGLTPLGLHDPQAFELPNFGIYKHRIHFNLWPWMERVHVSYDEEAFYLSETEYTFDANVTDVLLRPMGQGLRFPIQKVVLSNTLATQALETATTERLDRIIEQLSNEPIEDDEEQP